MKNTTVRAHRRRGLYKKQARLSAKNGWTEYAPASSSMCGIAGIIRFDGRPVLAAEVQAMTKSISHRGPDDAGLFVEAGIGFGMARLAIVDLTPTGHQPLFNEDRTMAVVYNGEVYNHRDLRSRLEAEGHTFQGTSDTEVLVHGYEHFGAVELSRRLDGMFAFALLDRRRRRLLLARDGFGIKPLYIRRTGGQISFASEIRAFAHDGNGPPSIDPTFAHSFLRIGHIPSPMTAFSGVYKLEPGTLHDIDIDTGQERVESFYTLTPSVLESTDSGDLIERLRELLNSSVRRHLMADVPTGLFLSGGLDSSSLVIFANQHATRPKTFTIGFSASDRGDETRFAAEVADKAGNENIRIDLGPANLDDLGPIVAALEEPLADSAVLPLWYLCRGTSNHVKVALSGEGGDEVLGGYARYFWGPTVGSMRPVVLPYAEQIRHVTAQLPSRSLGPFNVARRVSKLVDSLHLDAPARYLAWFDIFTQDERLSLIGDGPDPTLERYQRVFATARSLRLDAVQQLQYVDFHTTLLDNLLMKADKISMAHSLEVRVPLLDRRLVEFGLALPSKFKVGLMRDKRLMRRLLEPTLGARLAHRPKRGFEIPVDTWFRDPAAEHLRQALIGGALVKNLGFDSRAIRAMIHRHLSGEDVGRKLFALTSLQRWAEHFA
jgi:asparagine synthase (glutamine-hydrolysing)